MSDPRHDFARAAFAEAGKAVPPVGTVVGAAVAGLTLNEWVAIATFAYVLLQSAFLLWKWRREARRAREIDGLMKGPVADYKPRIGSHRTKQDE